MIIQHLNIMDVIQQHGTHYTKVPNMKKVLLYIIIGIFLISFISASSLGVFKQYDCVSLYQLCDNCTYVNITTVTYPNSTILTLNALMTKTGVDYNYSFCETTPIGDYSYKVCGDKNGIFTCENIDFIVTGNGQAPNVGTTTFLIVLALAIVLLLIAFIFHNYIFSFFSGLTFLLTGVYGMIYGFSSALQEYTQMISLIIIGIGAIITIVSSIDLINELSEGSSGSEKDYEDND